MFSEMAAPQPYKISVPDSDLEDLQQRLKHARLPSQLKARDGDDWASGTPVAEIEKLVKYWREDFDWRKAEAELNGLPQFITQINVEDFEPINIHCTSGLRCLTQVLLMLTISSCAPNKPCQRCDPFALFPWM